MRDDGKLTTTDVSWEAGLNFPIPKEVLRIFMLEKKNVNPVAVIWALFLFFESQNITILLIFLWL